MRALLFLDLSQDVKRSVPNLLVAVFLETCLRNDRGKVFEDRELLRGFLDARQVCVETKDGQVEPVVSR